LIYKLEGEQSVKVTYNELYSMVAKCAYGLREIGIKKGDRIAGFITNSVEAVVGMLAAASMGAIWSSCSPDFGFQGVLDRFGQIKPAVLFAVGSYQYNSKIFDCTEKINEIVKSLPDLKKLILISSESNEINSEKCQSWSEFTSNKAQDIEFEQLPFDHPIYIMYSSGTTGIPKCIVHGAGGTLLQHYKELSLHTNLNRNDVISYFTTCGWMMWNWLVSSLFIGCSVFLYDGSPVAPDISILWKCIDEEKITVFGTSPKFLSACQKNGLTPKDDFNLRSLKAILSTGAPLISENFNWIYDSVKNDVRLSSIAGGTDIISCFMLGNPNLPVYSEEIQCRGLGMKVESFDDNGKSIIDSKGELVCTKPFPSMPVGFWNDENNSKYQSAYFDDYPGIWKHGDYIKVTKNGGVIVYGRSDATLNPGGVRIGTSEIYRIIESVEKITDSIVAGQNWNNDTRIILFVVLRDGLILDDDLKKYIKSKIRSELTPRHVPKIVKQVSAVPVTLSGKKVELAVTKILNGEEVNNKSAIANPESLSEFEI